MRLDHQDYFDECEHCHDTFKVTRGSVFEDKDGIAIYMAAMHGCKRPSVDLAIGIRQGYNGATETSAIFIKAHPTADEIQMTVVDPNKSFWQTEDYLGKHLSRDEALASPLLKSFFQIADHVVTEIPELREYLAV